MGIGDSGGTFLRVDQPAVAMARPSMARVCIEVDICKNLPMEIGIKVGGSIVWQKLVYQNLPSYCGNCRMQEHSTRACKQFYPALSTKNINQTTQHGSATQHPPTTNPITPSPTTQRPQYQFMPKTQSPQMVKHQIQILVITSPMPHPLAHLPTA